MATKSVKGKGRFTFEQLQAVERATEERVLEQRHRCDTVPTKPQRVEHEKGGNVELTGLVEILMRRTHKHGADLGDLSDAELVTVRNQAENVTTGYLNGLRCLGNLVSSHDPNVMDVDTNSLGWLVGELVDGVELMWDVEGSAEIELQRRGYNFLGIPLSITERV